MVIDLKTVEKLWDSCLDIAAFAGVGYLSGRIVNQLTKWTSKPTLFGVKAAIDLKSATICCGLFILIDRMAQSLLLNFVKEKRVNKPVYSVLRMGVSAMGAINLLNAVAGRFQLVSLETKMAGTVIATAVFVYSKILLHLHVFNMRP